MNHETTSGTPETDRHTGLRFAACELIATARGIERERDEARAQLREEQRLHVQALAERDEARKLFESSKRARASLSEACDHLQAERDTAQAALATTRDVLCDTLPDANVPTAELARMICGAWTRAMDALKPGGMLDILTRAILTRATHDTAAAIRERDEAREKLRDLIEEEKTLRYTLRILSKDSAEKRIEVSDRLDKALAERDEARKTLEETRQGICDWEQTEDGQWLTDCGNAFEFTDGSPIYNDFICCPYCRKNLTETPYVDDADSDN
jgi:hypothetical protein